jgi:serine/threonine protein kinase
MLPDFELYRQTIAAALPYYEIHEMLGQGGQGIVVAGTDRVLRREVAIKILQGDPTPDARARFLEEAAMLATVEHAHVVRVFAGIESDGLHCLVMERLAMSLADLARRPRRPAEVVAWMMQAADGLGALHAQGGVHCDVKPSNLMLAADGALKVADFGVMTLVNTSITKRNLIAGSPTHLAPEQWRVERPSPATDLYALGIVMYELLTGRLPFHHDDLYALKQRHLYAAPPPMDDVSPPLADIVMRLLAKLPEQRYQSTEELRIALTGIANSLELDASAAAKTVWLEQPSEPATATTFVPTRIDRSRLRPVRFVDGSHALTDLRDTSGVGEIVFNRRPEKVDMYAPGSGDLCILYGDGAIARLPISGMDPDVSVHGELVCAYSSKIRTVRLDGSAEATLVDMRGFGDDCKVWNPRWSPDGSRLVFGLSAGNKQQRQHRRYIINRDATELREIYGGASWSPDGARLVLTAICPGSRPFRIGYRKWRKVTCFWPYILELSTGHLRLLDVGKAHRCHPVPRMMGSPEWSPDGRSIYALTTGFSGYRDRGIWIFSSTDGFATGGQAVWQDLAPSVPEYPRLSHLRVSAAGEILVGAGSIFPRGVFEPRGKLYVGSVYGGPFIPIIEGANGAFVPATWTAGADTGEPR